MHTSAVLVSLYIITNGLAVLILGGVCSPASLAADHNTINFLFILQRWSQARWRITMSCVLLQCCIQWDSEYSCFIKQQVSLRSPYIQKADVSCVSWLLQPIVKFWPIKILCDTPASNVMLQHYVIEISERCSTLFRSGISCEQLVWNYGLT